MRREMKLVGLILAHVERATACGNIRVPEVPGYEKHQVCYHAELCAEAGYIELSRYGESGKIAFIHRMTWSGHEVLTRLRAEHPDL